MEMKPERNKVVETKRGDVRGIQRKGYQRGILEGRRGHKQHVEKMATNIRKVASEVCGVTKGSEGEAKDTCWWNEKVQRTIKEKKECYRCLYHDRSVDNIEKLKGPNG